MKMVRKIAVACTVVAVVVLVFFFAPIVYWFSTGPYYQAFPHPSLDVTPVYRSLGCVTLGVGDSYGPDWFGLVVGCSPASFWSSCGHQILGKYVNCPQHEP
jgi:hypothetical protein